MHQRHGTLWPLIWEIKGLCVFQVRLWCPLSTMVWLPGVCTLPTYSSSRLPTLPTLPTSRQLHRISRTNNRYELNEPEPLMLPSIFNATADLFCKCISQSFALCLCPRWCVEVEINDLWPPAKDSRISKMSSLWPQQPWTPHWLLGRVSQQGYLVRDSWCFKGTLTEMWVNKVTVIGLKLLLKG